MANEDRQTGSRNILVLELPNTPRVDDERHHQFLAAVKDQLIYHNSLLQQYEQRIAALEAVEDWHIVGTDGEPAFENSWVWAGGGSEVPAFYIDPFGVVRLKGALSTGTSDTVVFTLPEGYRPGALQRFAIDQTASAAGARCRIDAAGKVIVTRTGTNAYLDSVSFRAG